MENVNRLVMATIVAMAWTSTVYAQETPDAGPSAADLGSGEPGVSGEAPGEKPEGSRDLESEPAQPVSQPAPEPEPTPPPAAAPTPVAPPPRVEPPVVKSTPEPTEEERKADLMALLKEAQKQKRRRPEGPFGSRLYAYPLVDMSYGFYQFPDGDDAATYLKFSDRGGFLPQLLWITFSAMGAQAQANQSGQTVEREIYVGSSVGMDVEIYADKGGLFDLYLIVAEEQEKLPTVGNIGFTFGRGIELGVKADAIFPIFRHWVNGELGGRIGIGDSWGQLYGAVVANPIDRLYVKFGALYAEDGLYGGDGGLGYNATVGVRL